CRRRARVTQRAITPVRSSSTDAAAHSRSVPLMVIVPVPSGRTAALVRGHAATCSRCDAVLMVFSVLTELDADRGHEGHGIGGGSVDADHEVQVATGRLSRTADATDLLSGSDLVALADQEPGGVLVQVGSPDAVAVVDGDGAVVVGVES